MVHGFRRLIRHRHLAAHRDALDPARHRKTKDFVFAQPSEIRLIERMIVGQAELAHLIRKSELPIMLHGSGILAVALRMPAFVGSVLKIVHFTP